MRIAPVNPETQQTDTTRTISGINVLTHEELGQMPFMDEGELDGDNLVFRRFFDVVISALSDPNIPDSEIALEALEMLDGLISCEKERLIKPRPIGEYISESFNLVYAEGTEEKVTLMIGVMPKAKFPLSYFHGFIDLIHKDSTQSLEIEIKDGKASLTLSP